MRLRKTYLQLVSTAVALAFGVTGAASLALAEDKKADAGVNKRAWIKICDDVKVQKVTEKDKAAKAAPKKICMTHHESLSARTGTPLVSAAVRSVEGQKGEKFLVTVPLGMALPAGVHIKIDDKEPIKFKYSFCHVAGCVAETVMTDALLKDMKAGKKMVVATISIAGKPIGFPVPLSGFGKAHAGKAIDGQKYADARKKMMLEIRKRQIEMATKKAKEKETGKAEKK